MRRITVLLLSVVLAQVSTPVSERPLDEQRLRHFSVRGPVEDKMLEYAIGYLTSSVAPFGIEFAYRAHPEGVTPRRSDVPITFRAQATTLGVALDRVLEHAPNYDWTLSAGVVNVRPKRVQGARTFLDERVPEFSLKDTTARRAIEALHRVFDPTYPSGPEALPRRMSLLTGADEDPQQFYKRLAVLDGRTFSVDVRHGTVRDALNAIVLAHGASAWTVNYATSQPHYSSAEITLLLGHGQMNTVTHVPFPSKTRMKAR